MTKNLSARAAKMKLMMLTYPGTVKEDTAESCSDVIRKDTKSLKAKSKTPVMENVSLLEIVDQA